MKQILQQEGWNSSSDLSCSRQRELFDVRFPFSSFSLTFFFIVFKLKIEFLFNKFQLDVHRFSLRTTFPLFFSLCAHVKLIFHRKCVFFGSLYRGQISFCNNKINIRNMFTCIFNVPFDRNGENRQILQPVSLLTWRSEGLFG
jgi:hypothetical protein